jgi:hypothetical protein
MSGKLSRYWPWLAFFLITLVGFGLRFWNIKNLPCGLFGDTAINGLEAIRGQFLPYYSYYGQHNEGLFTIILILLTKLIGVGQWQIQATSALIGSLTIPLTIAVIKRLHSWPIALLTGSLLATSPWHIALSRNGLHAVTGPVLILLLVAAIHQLTKSASSAKHIWSAIVGFVFGLGFYSYTTFRGTIPIAAILISVLLLKRKLSIASAILISAFAIITLTPLILFFTQNPKELITRANEISIFSAREDKTTKEMFVENIKGITLSLIGKGGDITWRSNLAQEPLLPTYLSIFLAIGLITLIINATKGYFWSLTFVVSFIILLTPAIFAYDSPPPHNMRLSGELPLIYLIVSIGLTTVLSRAPQILHRLPILPLILLLLTSGMTAHSFDLLQNLVGNPRFAADFRCDLTEVADTIKNGRLGSNIRNIYIIASSFDRYSLNLLLDGYNSRVEELDPPSIAYQIITKDDVVIAPVYGEYGFYHLDPPFEKTLPYGSNDFIKTVTDKYPDLKISHSNFSYHPNRYPQGISFIILTRSQ